MFRRIRYAAWVLRMPLNESAVEGRIPKMYGDDIVGELHRAHDGEHLPYNPAVRLIEMSIVVIITTFGIHPAIQFLFAPARAVSLSLTLFASFGLYTLVQQGMDRLPVALKGKLQFLDPYFGRRLTYARWVLSNGRCLPGIPGKLPRELA